ncbi:RlpA-like double-psi beta-barrel-protein domain-containing protein-containing protein [Mycena rosella]|uniref:RlpA-like double-psi beta-barrel-protein domain-containing protein-containing protein n=1 Tax=Mycena rosella TaxID=1033263 RepID=A0AAD7M8W0_MYCRO|nr:RlpA-like double-psi beta-barrel-protein domain-containing protein-containing protein [Mycena rosella]
MLCLSLLALVLPTVFASHIVPRNHHHHKRGDAHTGDKLFSFYAVGLGACGGTNSDSEYVVALNVPQWNNGANCNKEITITYNGKTANAKIVDECMSCPDGGLDFSTSLFNFFEDPDVGIIHGDWSFVGSQPIATTQDTITTTSHTTSHSSTTTSTKTKTTARPTTKSSSSASSTATSSSAATPTPSQGPQILTEFSNNLMGLLGLVVQGAQAA